MFASVRMASCWSCLSPLFPSALSSLPLSRSLQISSDLSRSLQSSPDLSRSLQISPDLSRSWAKMTTVCTQTPSNMIVISMLSCCEAERRLPKEHGFAWSLKAGDDWSVFVCSFFVSLSFFGIFIVFTFFFC